MFIQYNASELGVFRIMQLFNLLQKQKNVYSWKLYPIREGKLKKNKSRFTSYTWERKCLLTVIAMAKLVKLGYELLTNPLYSESKVF